ncbi:MAG: hypothetical protein IK024_01435 [Treponema sp.]|nr:hypothetical protein [Treponema sp.]
MNYCFWIVFSTIVVLFILEMINVIPVLKKGASQEEKIKRYPKTMILNSLMMLSGGILMVLSFKEKADFGSGIAFIFIGLLSLFFSILNIVKDKKIIKKTRL